MTRIIIFFIVIALTYLEVWFMSYGIINLWVLFFINGMLSAYYVTLYKLKQKDKDKIITFSEASKFWVAACLIINVPFVAISMPILALVTNPLTTLVFILSISVYLMVILAIENWSDLETD